MMIRFSSRESRRCVALVAVKGLLQRISCSEGVPPSRMTGRILTQLDRAI